MVFRAQARTRERARQDNSEPLAWGARGPGFKSRQPDQIPQRLTVKLLTGSWVLESIWSPNRTPAALLFRLFPRRDHH